MAVTATWTDPTLGTSDRLTGAVLDQAWVEIVLSNFDYIGGTAGTLTQRQKATGSSSNPTTTSTTYVDLTDMAVTLTTTGGDLLVWLQCDMDQNTGGANVTMALSLDAAAEVSPSVMNAPASGESTPIVCIALFTGVSAASHTIKGRWQTQSATTATAVGTRRVMTVIELKH